MTEIELCDVRLLIDIFGGWINILSIYISPFEHGFGTLFELVLITDDDLRPVRKRQSKVHPRPANIEVQIPVERKAGLRKRTIVRAAIIIIPAPFFKTATDEAKVGLVQSQLDLNIIIRKKSPAFSDNLFIC